MERKILDTKRCIHCHICRKHCSFLDKYGLDIGDWEKLEKLTYHCFLCGKCTQVCPIGIDGRGAILEMRQKRAEENGGKLKEKGYGLLLMEKRDYLFRNSRYSQGESLLFPGCNFPSFYPKTTQYLIKILQEKAGIGVYFDCCGKPVAELGLVDQEKAIIRKLRRQIEQSKAKELVTVCPNCYSFLKGKSDQGELPVQVVTIYETLKRLGLGRRFKAEGSLFVPCPDREKGTWQRELSFFAEQMPKPIERVSCCGLGGCAAGKERELSVEMAREIGRRAQGTVYTYCASCAGAVARNSRCQVFHFLPEILGIREFPDTGKSFLNRIRTKFL